MSETKHTKGPWVIDAGEPRDVLASDDSGELLATAYPMGDEEDAEGHIEGQANARLIAAAPDMYEALKVAHATIHALEKINDPAWTIYMANAPEIKMILAAIAKAEGRA